MLKEQIINGQGRDIDFIAGNGGCHWEERWGLEQIHRYVAPLVREGDQVLDLGSGFGRSSLPLAFKGAEVTALDSDPESLSFCREQFSLAGLPVKTIEGRVEDLCEGKISLRNGFNFVVAVDVLTHLRKKKAVKTISRLPKFLKKKGVLVVNYPSTLSWSYHSFRDYNPKVEPYTYLNWCDCSGVPRHEPFSFFEPGEVENMVKKMGGQVLAAERSYAPHGNHNWFVAGRF